MEKQQHVVVSVHGTFAATNANDGSAWWQHDSDFWHKLAGKLRANCHQIPKEQTFHWDSDNSAASRRKAARNLLALVIELEGKEQPYHLIGHSHGGSVIWDTLILAHRRFKREWAKKSKGNSDFQCLQHLVSWTTIGTPFVIARPSPPRMFFAVFAGIIALIALIFAVSFPILVWTGFLTDPSVEADLNLISTWTLTATYGVLFYLTLSPTIAGLEAHQLDGELRCGQRVLSAFAGRWLCLWHSDDEAINGLIGTLQLSGVVIPRRSVISPIFEYPLLTRLYFPISVITAPIFNYVLAPIGDRFVWGRVKKKSVGNDRPGTHVRQVTTVPVAGSAEIPAVLDRVQQAMNAEAYRAMQNSAVTFRRLLSELGSGLKGVIEKARESDLTGRELIHTSYFDNSDIVALIGAHIRESSGAEYNGDLPEDCRRWRKQQKEITDRFSSARIRKTIPLVLKILLIQAAIVAVCIKLFLPAQG